MAARASATTAVMPRNNSVWPRCGGSAAFADLIRFQGRRMEPATPGRQVGHARLSPMARLETGRQPKLRPRAGGGSETNVRFSNRPSGSSTFRLSTTTVSMSLAGSCFSSESAPGPFHHGIRGRGGTIFRAALPTKDRSKRTCELTSSIVPRGTSFHG